MAEYKIEHEVEIDAPIEVVWRTITSPEQIARWFANCAPFQVAPGATSILTFVNDEGDVVHTAPLVVEAVDEPSHFSFRWCHPDGSVPVAGNSTLVEFNLERVGSDRTGLRLIESGLDQMPMSDEERVSFADDHNNGWSSMSKRLAGLFVDPSK